MARDQVSPLLVLVGETSSGKSSLALQLAQRFNGEIISADSASVHRGADIGTAKPTLAEQSLVPYNLIDVVGPNEPFTAADFQRQSQEAINEINNKNKLPIIAGGTGLYIDSLLYNYSFLPIRKQDQLNSLCLEDLQNKAKSIGLNLENLDMLNKRRLVRYIEINGAQPNKQKLRPNTLILGLSVEREVIKKRITSRLDSMLEAGLEEEVRSLAEKYGWDCIVLQVVGYSQWKRYFEGDQSFSETRQFIIKATNDLAKRQRTWFKRNKSIQWFVSPVNLSEIVDLVTTFLSN